MKEAARPPPAPHVPTYRQGAFHIDFILVNGIPHFLEMGFRLSGMGVTTTCPDS
jgi:hypothetical protein